MGLREDLQKKIEKKQAELVEAERAYERDRAAALAYIQALVDTIKSLPREASEVSADKLFRRGSAMAKTRELILEAKQPLHITTLLSRMGRDPGDGGARASLTGALGAYVRRGEVFVRPRPNTFGLIELGHHNTDVSDDEPPEDFGGKLAT